MLISYSSQNPLLCCTGPTLALPWKTQECYCRGGLCKSPSCLSSLVSANTVDQGSDLNCLINMQLMKSSQIAENPRPPDGMLMKLGSQYEECSLWVCIFPCFHHPHVSLGKMLASKIEETQGTTKCSLEVLETSPECSTAGFRSAMP